MTTNTKLEERFAEFVEKGAALEHARWARWQNHVHNKCNVNQFGDWILPREERERWQRQISASYSELSEEEKESDRREVREYLPLIAQERAQVVKEAREVIEKKKYTKDNPGFKSQMVRGYNEGLDMALDALSRIGQEHD